MRRRCGDGGCADVTGGEGIADADMAVYVTARQTEECGPSTTAHAVACVRDDDNWCAPNADSLQLKRKAKGGPLSTQSNLKCRV